MELGTAIVSKLTLLDPWTRWITQEATIESFDIILINSIALSGLRWMRTFKVLKTQISSMLSSVL
jgi:hypothetical protein